MNKISFKWPLITIFLFNFFGFLTLTFFYESNQNIMLYGGVFLLLSALSYFLLRKMSMEDQYIFLITVMLFSIGVIMLFRLDKEQGAQQVIMFCIGLAVFFISYFLILKTKLVEKLGYTFIIGAVGLPILTLLIAPTINGAKNWIFIGGFSVQTSEIVKYLVVFFLADRYCHPERYRWFGLHESLVSSALVYMVLGLLVLQREWGTAVVIFLLHFSMMFVFREKTLAMLINGGLATVGLLLGAKFMPHIQSRISAWLDPWADPNGKGYALTRSLIAMSEGGFFGTGIGVGSPAYISEPATDFIFAAICEEFGILGGVAVVLLYFLLVYRGIRLAMNIAHPFYKVVCAGICILLGFQAFIILGGVTKMIPLTGITLPFISAGGSSLLVSFMAIGFLEGAANKSFIEPEEGGDIA